jgi:hypothetical protein
MPDDTTRGIPRRKAPKRTAKLTEPLSGQDLERLLTKFPPAVAVAILARTLDKTMRRAGEHAGNRPKGT